MARRPATGNGVFILSAVFNVVTLGVAWLVLNFMHDLARDPQCEGIDTITREGLAGYAWLMIAANCIGLLINMYLGFSI